MGTIKKQPVGSQFQKATRNQTIYPRLLLPKAKLIIELDGSQHLEQEEYDQERTEYLEEQGYKVTPKGDDVRFGNNDVMNDIEGIILATMHALEDGEPRQKSRRGRGATLSRVELLVLKELLTTIDL